MIDLEIANHSPSDLPAVRAMRAIAPTQAEAEQQVLSTSARVRVLRSREINLDGVRPMLSTPLEKHWAVVFVPEDFDERDEQPADPSPEDVCERETQIFYLRLAVDPSRIVSDVIEEFRCPACGTTVHLELPAQPDPPKEDNCQCRRCGTPLTRAPSELHWRVRPPTKSPPAPCIFCGVLDRSREHAIPVRATASLGPTATA